MADRNRSWLEELERALLSAGSTLPTTALGRLRRTVGAAFRGGRLAWNGRGGEDLDLEALGALVGSVGQLKGIAMKAGQMLSYLDLPLPQEVKDAFSALQTHSASLSFEEIAALVRAELDDRAEPLL
ncbi:MAG TPA: hypothetical protein VFE90_03065, partial [Myxococcales bacterium]|nr:hypothetical protein [Myxococcales bacterium]